MNQVWNVLQVSRLSYHSIQNSVFNSWLCYCQIVVVYLNNFYCFKKRPYPTPQKRKKLYSRGERAPTWTSGKLIAVLSLSLCNLEYIVFSVLSLLALILKWAGWMSLSSFKPTCYTVYYLFILVIAIIYLALTMHQGLYKTLHRISHIMCTATE